MRLNRREFVKCTVAAGLCMGFGPVTLSRAGAGPSKSSDAPGPGMAIPALDSRRKSILHHAGMAPSGHNCQPWRVRIGSADEWIVEADPQRRLPVVDPENRELMLSLGAFTENLLLAAGAMGYACEIQVIALDPFDREVLRVRLHQEHPKPYPLRRLTTRMTAKQGYRSDEIRSTDIETLRAAADGRLSYFPKGSKHAACIREAAVTCFRIQSGRDAAQQELVRWLRLSEQDVRTQRDGLTVKGMGMQGFKGWFLSHFAKPEDFMKADYRQKGIDSVAMMANEGGGWIVINSQGHAVTDLIETGRRFERMALLAREMGIGLHPMTQLLEEKEGLEQLAAHHGGRVIPQFVIRVGYLDKYPEPVSPRRLVESFTYKR